MSLVIRQASGVSTRRRDAVLAAIEELGYKPSRAATTLAGSRSKSIGVVIDDYSNLWFVNLLDGIRHIMDTHNYHVTVSDQHSTGPFLTDAVDGFLAMHIDGIVMAAEPGAVAQKNLDVPVVVAGEREGHVPGADVVANDEALGAALAVEHLISLGHRRIGHLSGLGGSAARRRESYVETMKRANLRPLVFGTFEPTTEHGGYRGCVELLEHNPDVTAVFAANDTMALGALGALQERGLRVPNEVSLVGFDNSPLAGSHVLDLTTIDNRNFEVGIEVATRLLSRIEGGDSAPHRSLIAPELVVRSSTSEPIAARMATER